jgi:hypothetical protein
MASARGAKQLQKWAFIHISLGIVSSQGSFETASGRGAQLRALFNDENSALATFNANPCMKDRDASLDFILVLLREGPRDSVHINQIM